MNLFAYWNSNRMVFAMYRAREVDASSGGHFFAVVQELAVRAGLLMPRVYVIDEAQANAFATGRNPHHAAVATTTGIMQLLTERELREVRAHELTHVKNRDTFISTVSASIAGAISVLANFGTLFGGRDSEGRQANPLLAIAIMIVAPFAAMLIQMAFHVPANLVRMRVVQKFRVIRRRAPAHCAKSKPMPGLPCRPRRRAPRRHR